MAVLVPRQASLAILCRRQRLHNTRISSFLHTIFKFFTFHPSFAAYNSLAAYLLSALLLCAYLEVLLLQQCEEEAVNKSEQLRQNAQLLVKRTNSTKNA